MVQPLTSPKKQTRSKAAQRNSTASTPTGTKNKNVGGAASKLANNTPKASGSTPKANAQGDNAKGKQTQSTVEVYPCVTCNSNVGEGEKALPCDFCSRYTHLTCDGRMSDGIYAALEADNENSLVYLCVDCKPTLLASHDTFKSLLVHVTQRLDQAMSTDREPIAEKILNRLSAMIEGLDRQNREHVNNIAQVSRTLEQLETSNLSQLSQELSNQRECLSEIIASTHKLMSDMEDLKSRDPPVACGHSSGHTRNIPSLMNMTQRQNMTHEFERQNGPTQQQPLSSWWNSQPLPPQIRQPPPNNPQPHSNQSNNSRSHLSENPIENVSDPDRTIVVYRLANENPPYLAIEQLMLRCEIYQSQVVAGDWLYRPRSNRKPPLFITCDSESTKFRFMSKIGKLRQTGFTDYEHIYARPFMNPEEIQQDKELKQKLTQIRQRLPLRTFKIYKGAIHERTENDFIPFREEDVTNPVDDPASQTDDQRPALGAEHTTNAQDTESHADPQNRPDLHTNPQTRPDPQNDRQNRPGPTANDRDQTGIESGAAVQSNG